MDAETRLCPMPPEEAMARAQNPQGLSPAGLYAALAGAETAIDSPVPRPLTTVQLQAAKLGHPLGYMSMGWIIFACLLLPLTVVGGVDYVALVFILVFLAVGFALLKYALKIGMERAGLARDGRLVWAVVAGIWQEEKRIREPGQTGTRRITTSDAVLLYPGEDGGTHAARMPAGAPGEITVGQRFLLVHPPGRAAEVQGAAALAGGLGFTAAGELTVDPSKVELTYKVHKAMRIALRVSVLLTVVIVVVRAVVS